MYDLYVRGVHIRMLYTHGDYTTYVRSIRTGTIQHTYALYARGVHNIRMFYKPSEYTTYVCSLLSQLRKRTYVIYAQPIQKYANYVFIHFKGFCNHNFDL